MQLRVNARSKLSCAWTKMMMIRLIRGPYQPYLTIHSGWMTLRYVSCCDLMILCSCCCSILMP
jgi:hypothetical protein